MPTSILTLARMLSLDGSYGLSLLGISSTAGTGCEGTGCWWWWCGTQQQTDLGVDVEQMPDHVGTVLVDEHNGNVFTCCKCPERILYVLGGGFVVDKQEVGLLAQVDIANAREEKAGDAVLVANDSKQGLVC